MELVRKILPVFFIPLFLLSFIVNPSLVLAQDENASPELTSEQNQTIQKMVAPDYYPIPNNKPLPFAGQNHAYSVILRGNGEAVITLKVALTNTSSDGRSLTKTLLRLPRVMVSDIAVYQIITQGYCTRYDNGPQYMGTPYSSIPYNPRCIEYSDPDYYNYYGGGKYQKADFDYSGDTLTIDLPTPIQNEKSGAF